MLTCNALNGHTNVIIMQFEIKVSTMLKLTKLDSALFIGKCLHIYIYRQCELCCSYFVCVCVIDLTLSDFEMDKVKGKAKMVLAIDITKCTIVNVRCIGEFFCCSFFFFFFGGVLFYYVVFFFLFSCQIYLPLETILLKHFAAFIHYNHRYI